jgi:hypothetical protein
MESRLQSEPNWVSDTVRVLKFGRAKVVARIIRRLALKARDRYFARIESGLTMPPKPGQGLATLANDESKTHAREAHSGLAQRSAIIAVTLPAILFYSVLFRTTLNLPILDDYNAILNFLNRWVECRTASEKFVWFLSSQLVDVKTFFIHAVALAEYLAVGHVNFRFLTLCYVGLIPPLVLLLWKMFIPSCSNKTVRLVLFLPVSFLVFQLQYMTELDVVTTGMQHIAGLLFSFLTIYWLHQNTRSYFAGASAALIFAIASDANGFMVIPIVFLTLLRERRFGRLAVFLAVSIGCVAAYAFHYDHHVSPVDANQNSQSFAQTLAVRILYVLGFLGSAAGFNTHFLPGGLILGASLVAFFVWKIARGDARHNRLLYDCVLFLFLTAVIAASGRSGLGISQSLSGRYTLYSLTCVSLFWMVLVEDFVVHRSKPFESGPFLMMMICSVVFSLSWDLMGYWGISQRDQSLTASILEFEHPSPANPDPFPVPNYRFPGPKGVEEGIKLCEGMRSIMKRSIELGIYRPKL